MTVVDLPETNMDCARCGSRFEHDEEPGDRWCETCWTYIRYSINAWASAERRTGLELPELAGVVDEEMLAALKGELHRAWLTIEKLESELAVRTRTYAHQKSCEECRRRFTHDVGLFAMPGRIRVVPLNDAARHRRSIEPIQEKRGEVVIAE
ncbi:hypothetical protein LF1_07280 [Rubripirellula obstinata]|uniref:Uncharacterized protein n=1 Tax=Rubripirellula obstinata TaxID=406547 RepID=A0A5B1CDC2_9BACT|nr:hypothetical protein [Rubripirellula obstinata]KAA1258212.1 hypothetical protein LF1_07280 [Rubripirellula obstinata]